jgi:hypothetical protein
MCLIEWIATRRAAIDKATLDGLKNCHGTIGGIMILTE